MTEIGIREKIMEKVRIFNSKTMTYVGGRETMIIIRGDRVSGI